MKNLAAIITLVVLCLWTGDAKAQLFLEEGKVVLAVSGSERISKTLTVHNTTKENIRIKVYWEDFEYQPPYDGTKNFLPAGSAPSSAGKWVSYSPQEFTLAPFAIQQIAYTVSVPPQIEGGHYGVLFFERADPIKDVSGLNIVTRAGCLFFIEPKAKVKKASLENVKRTGPSVSGDFVNQGDVILIPHVTYYLMDEQGAVADRGQIRKLYVPPGKTAPFEITLPASLKGGHYTMVLNADLGDGDVAVKEMAL